MERFALDSLFFHDTAPPEVYTLSLLVALPIYSVLGVAVGNSRCQNHGRVIRITEQRMALSELVQDGAGRWMEREASLALIQDGKRGK